MAIKVKGILPNNQDVQQLKDDKVMNQPTREEGGNEHHELIENCRETGDGEDLCCDQGHDSNGSGPQGCAKEFHGNFKDHRKEGDDNFGFIAHLTKNGSKDKAEENNPQSVGSWTTTKDSKDFRSGIRICGVFWSLLVGGESLLVRGLDDVVCNYIPGRRERDLKRVLLLNSNNSENAISHLPRSIKLSSTELVFRGIVASCEISMLLLPGWKISASNVPIVAMRREVAAK